ncbi:MAG: 6-carboxytetrahydropterin synthase [Saprospiraceae bacterium]|nr:6-carboxytetrahydropterin synthase [Saprospiraceae bacterium]MCB9319192.1 6-carboxytetrahydropterin synthase [Lewinellaceae bacterium]
MVYVTRIEKFNAAHKLWVKDWPDEKNWEVFGKCANPNWHGHNYTLYVTVKGKPDPVTGFLLDARVLSQIINQEVLEHLDHKNLNLDVPFIPPTMLPSTENLVMVIWDLLKDKIPSGQLHAIKLYETEKIYVEYFGE